MPASPSPAYQHLGNLANRASGHPRGALVAHQPRSFLGGQRWRHLAQRRWRQHVQQHECQHHITQFYDIAVDPGDANIVFGGAQDNSSSGRRTSTVWNLTFASGDGFMNAIDENDPSIVFQTSYPSSGLPYIVRSTTGGAPGSFTRMSNTGLGSGNFPWVTPLATAGSQLFVASDEVYRANTLGGVDPGQWQWAARHRSSPPTRGVTPTYVGTSAEEFFGADAKHRRVQRYHRRWQGFRHADPPNACS
jgi:hypothetical protein